MLKLYSLLVDSGEDDSKNFKGQKHVSQNSKFKKLSYKKAWISFKLTGNFQRNFKKYLDH